MSDLYSELLVQRKQDSKDMLIRYGLIALIAIAVAGGIVIHPILFIVAIVLGVAAYFVLPRLDVEFEYLHVNDELDVDKIFSKSKRKKAQSIDLNKTEVLAPLGSHHLDPYKNLKTVDYSANDSEKKPYVLVITSEKEQQKIMLQLDKSMLDNIRRRMPRKVFDD